MWEEHAVHSVGPEEVVKDVQSRLRAHPALPAKAGRESIEANGSVDVKTLIIGRESTITGGCTYKSAVTESVYKRERSVMKDAQEQDRYEVKTGSGIRDEEQ